MKKVDKALRQYGAKSIVGSEREAMDYYATCPEAVHELMRVESFCEDILEPCCGGGHIAKILEETYGKEVYAYDKYDHGYGQRMDFFGRTHFGGDIITNPPYCGGLDFVRHALEIVPEGRKVAMFLKLLFLEGIERRKFFDEHPPKWIYVSTRRMYCAKNGDFDAQLKRGTNAICFAWFVWVKGFKGVPSVAWIN